MAAFIRGRLKVDSEADGFKPLFISVSHGNSWLFPSPSSEPVTRISHPPLQQAPFMLEDRIPDRQVDLSRSLLKMVTLRYANLQSFLITIV